MDPQQDPQPDSQSDPQPDSNENWEPEPDPSMCWPCLKDPCTWFSVEFNHSSCELTPIPGMDSPHVWECGHCSDYRGDNPEAGDICVWLDRSQDEIWRRPGRNAPTSYEDPNRIEDGALLCCDICRGDRYNYQKQKQCDVDPMLNIGCSSCMKTVTSGLPDVCSFLGKPLRNRPSLESGHRPWYRRSCDCCRIISRTKSSPPCSWLLDRRNWPNSCNHCRYTERPCTDNYHLIDLNKAMLAPMDWNPGYRKGRAGPCEVLNQSTPFRAACMRCVIDGKDCRVFLDRILYACARCSQIGVDCVSNANKDDKNKIYPLFSLSSIGFGAFCPFRICQRCLENGRDCDRQRPCDSCLKHKEQCGADGAGSEGCIKGRLDRPPALYYLAMGYDSSGVESLKDNSKMEHWIGPLRPVYAQQQFQSNGISYRQHPCVPVVRHLRSRLMPPGRPYHEYYDSQMMPSSLRVEDLRDLICKDWKGARPPREVAGFAGAYEAWDKAMSSLNGSVEGAEEEQIEEEE